MTMYRTSSRGKLAGGIVWFIAVGLTLAQTDNTEPWAYLQMASDWAVQAVVPAGKLQCPLALACDRSGRWWVVDKVADDTRLIVCLPGSGRSPGGQGDVTPTSLRQVRAICTWGDWLYVAAQDRLLRYRLSATGLEEPGDVVLSGLPARGPIYLSATPRGLWLGTRGGELAQPGRQPLRLPRCASSWTLVPHNSGPLRLLHWESALWCGASVSDGLGRNHWLGTTRDALPRWYAWDTWRNFLIPGRSPGMENPDVVGISEETRASELALPPWSWWAGWPDDYVFAPLVGPAFVYAQEDASRLPTLVRLWARVWPGQVFAETLPANPEARKKPVTYLTARAPAQLWLTVVTNGPEGAVYLAGQYRIGQNPAQGFVWRWQPKVASQFVAPYPSGQELAQLETSALLERLASENPWELRAVEQEICRRGCGLAKALVELAQRLSSEDADPEKPPPSEKLGPRALELAAVLDAAAARELALHWARSGKLPWILASTTVLARSPDPEARLALARLLADRSSQVRQAAALALGEMGGSESASHLVQFLRVHDERELTVGLALVRALESCGKEGLDALAELFDSGSTSELNVALTAWTHLRHPEALSALDRFLKHPHLRDEQRYQLFRWWGELAAHYPANGQPILNWLEKQSSVPTDSLAEALRALAQAPGDWQRLGRLAESYLSHESVAVRLAAIRCCRTSGLTAAGPKLLRLVQENARSVQERITAAEVLLQLRNPEVVPMLLARLADSSESASFREQAAALLLLQDNHVVRQAVLDRLQSWPDEMVHETIGWLRWQREPLLFLAEAASQNKLSADKCLRALREGLALWALVEPRAAHFFDRFSQRLTSTPQEQP
ncbi:MAG: HEAT repeat domain-containing protein [Gemmatales bacterium]|nr:HEAT repeat domain-containing protein [Gemmatales bacterium]